MLTATHPHPLSADPPPVALQRGNVPNADRTSFAAAWKYPRARGSRIRFVVALLMSVGVHAAILFGVRQHKPVVKRAVDDDVVAISIVMPQIKELEDIDLVPSDSEPPPDIGVVVPTLADVPTVAAPTDFVQRVDFSSLVERPDLSNVRLTAIPENITRNRKLEGLGSIFNLSELDRVPEPIVQAPPIFPPAMKREAQSATVKVEFVVDSTGRVVAPYVVESTHFGFNEAAVTGVARWKFRPGIRGGRRVNTRMQVPIVFRIAEAD
jgi:protein TonB